MHLPPIFQKGFEISAEISRQSPSLEKIRILTELDLNDDEILRRDSGESSIHTLACELAVRWAWSKVDENHFKDRMYRRLFTALYQSFENMLTFQQTLDSIMIKDKEPSL